MCSDCMPSGPAAFCRCKEFIAALTSSCKVEILETIVIVRVWYEFQFPVYVQLVSFIIILFIVGGDGKCLKIVSPSLWQILSQVFFLFNYD